MSTRTRWRAVDPSGLAHAFVASGAHALCGVRNQPEIHDWPARIRCALCMVREELVSERERLARPPTDRNDHKGTSPQ